MKISVIIPVYNAEKNIQRCAESVLAQDMEDLELILVDDGSRDGSPALLDSLAAADRRVRVIHKPNGGVSSARNRGLAEARGEYVQFADADDRLPMDSCKLLLREAESTGADMVIADFYRVVDESVSRKGSIEKGGLLSRREYADEMLRSPADLYYGALWNKLYRRSIIEEHGVRMDENISFSEDMIFNLEYLLHVKSVAVTKAPVYYYVMNRGSLVSQSLDLGATVRMKTSVIKYYDRFYRDTFDLQEYSDRLPVIYGYMLAFSTDFLNLPLMPGTSKLGRESGAPVCMSESLEGSPLQESYLSSRLMDRYVSSLGKRLGLGSEQVLMLYLLMKAGRPCSSDDVSGFLGISRVAAAPHAAKLLALGYVRFETALSLREKQDMYSFSAPELKDELLGLEQDLDRVRLEGFSEEDIKTLRRLEERVSVNIEKRLSAETL
ncbi:MAG: glycosyltransferase [Firmicutes bacterium]|nr:glycosyltransferase [Bacillota bacterium]